MYEQQHKEQREGEGEYRSDHVVVNEYSPTALFQLIFDSYQIIRLYLETSIFLDLGAASFISVFQISEVLEVLAQTRCQQISNQIWD